MAIRTIERIVMTNSDGGKWQCIDDVLINCVGQLWKNDGVTWPWWNMTCQTYWRESENEVMMACGDDIDQVMMEKQVYEKLVGRA